LGHVQIWLPADVGFRYLAKGFALDIPALSLPCAVAIQKTMAERNATVDPARRMQFRIGVNLGDVIHDETRVYGDGVNIAARLESIAEPGGICVSAVVYDQVHKKLPVTFADLGAQSAKY
jgi:adenylate cyclase